ncbi:hypothetical protein SO802_002786 [Lithocarpus litseifolius]|uniref:Uncharacterized protein n=1 Tax=Lithocarpus litseifolius TaxID=425828 RepID=A0AAW2DYS0_9ROSI
MKTWVDVNGRSQFRFVFAKLSLRYVDDGYGELSEVDTDGGLCGSAARGLLSPPSRWWLPSPSWPSSFDSSFWVFNMGLWKARHSLKGLEFCIFSNNFV